MEDIFYPHHYSRLLNVPISKAFKYFSDFESYPIQYPHYCNKVDIKTRSENIVLTKEFWNVSINNKIDHVILDVNYTLSPPRKIQYEIVDGFEKAVGIMNAILLNERENDHTGIKGNNVLLDVISFPPHSIKSHRYEEMIDYFITQDCIHLENRPVEPFKEGQLCIKCGKGNLETPRTKEIFEENNYRRKIVFWKCDFCGFEYQGINQSRR